MSLSSGPLHLLGRPRSGICLVAFLLAALTSACDEPVAAGRTARLTIVPVFAPGKATEALALTIDSVHVIVWQHGVDVRVAERGQHVTPDQSDVTLDITIPVQGTRDTVDVMLLLLAGGTQLFSGVTPVEVRVGAVAAPAEIPLTYVGADTIVAWLTIQPYDTVMTLGDSLQFQVRAWGPNEQELTDFFASWSTVPVPGTTPVGVALSRAGTLHAASNASQVYVKATAGNGVADSVLVAFIPTLGSLAKFSGDSTSVAGGTTFPVAVRVTDTNGQPVQHVPVAFSVTTANGYPYLFQVPTDTFGIARTDVYAYTLPVGTGSQPIQVEALVTGLPAVTFSGTIVAFLAPPVAISTGITHTCQIRSGGALYCWGSNTTGQLGDGTRTSRLIPTRAATGFSFAAVSAGSDHTCALTAAGTAYCWGGNASGQLGDSTFTTRTAPSLVAGGLQFTRIVAGASFTCALTATGAAYCWGNGIAGQLGNGGTGTWNAPRPVSGGLTFASLSLFGDNHACGLYYTSAFCWGYNFDGEIGDSTTATRYVPTAVTGGISFSQVVSGWYHGCGIEYYSHVAYCWGDNNVWQLGWGTPPQDGLAPGAVQGGRAFIALAAGGGHTCGLLSNGAAYCWGYNTEGGLGDGTTTWSLAPVPVSGGLTFSQIAAGDGFTCGLTPGGQLYCWGRNTSGQLGDNSTTNRPAPVLIP